MIVVTAVLFVGTCADGGLSWSSDVWFLFDCRRKTVSKDFVQGDMVFVSFRTDFVCSGTYFDPVIKNARTLAGLQHG